MDSNKALDQVGRWGYYQKRLFVVLVLTTLPDGLTSLHFRFTNLVPSHRCLLSEDVEKDLAKDTSEAADETLRLFIPAETDDTTNITSISQCDMFANRTYSTYGKYQLSTTNCRKGMYYYLSPHHTTAAADFSMVCDKDWLVALSVAADQFGLLCGSLLSGLADRFGRRVSFLVSSTCFVTGVFCISLSWNPAVYVAFNFATALFRIISYGNAFVLGTEMMSPSLRNAIGTSLSLMYGVSICLCAVFAYFIREWRWFLRSLTGASLVLLIPGFCLFPESVKWLVQRGRQTDAVELLEKISKANGYRRFNKESMGSLSLQEAKEESTNSSCLIGFKTLFCSGIAVRCIVLAYAWFSSSLAYSAISIFSVSFSKDIYINMVLVGLSEVPAIPLCWYSLKTLGRPVTMCYFMLIAGISSGILPFLHEDNWTAKTILSVFGKGSMSATFYCCYIITFEIAPTLQRGTLFSYCSGIGRIGSITAPFIMYKNPNGAVPYWVIAGLSVTSGILSLLFLPETKAIHVPDTIEECRNNDRIIGSRCYKWFISKAANKAANPQESKYLLERTE